MKIQYRAVLALVGAVFFSGAVSGQGTSPRPEHVVRRNDEWKALGYKVPAYALIGCIAAHIKKQGWRECGKKAMKLFPLAVLDHFAMREETYGRHATAKPLFDAATSWTTNVLQDRPMFCRYRSRYLWARFSYDFCKKEFDAKVLLGPTVQSLVLAADPKADFDAGESFRSGIPFFRTKGRSHAGARESFGVVIFAENRPSGDPSLDSSSAWQRYREATARRHEGLHVLQYDRGAMFSDEIEKATLVVLGKAFRKNFGGVKLPFSFGQDVFSTFGSFGNYPNTPNELEARTFDHLVLCGSKRRELFRELKKEGFFPAPDSACP